MLKRYWRLKAAGLGLVVLATAGEVSGQEVPAPVWSNFVAEGYPAKVWNSIKKHNDSLSTDAQAAAPKSGPGKNVFASVMIKAFRRWQPGGRVTVAFNGGNPQLYALIEKTAKEWVTVGNANLELSFRNADGSFRTWDAEDLQYAGVVRISFDQPGYWSLVGTDAVMRDIWGGSPNQASMNFQGFNRGLPANWHTVVLHEFGHALGFEHEHQSPAVECGFRFEDDPGYIPTTDYAGAFVPDKYGRRPGLYTYLGGPPNDWDRDTVDFNLRTIAASSGYPLDAFEVSDYDPKSIMEYYFEPAMFVAGRQSPCAIARENSELSAQDRKAVANAYRLKPAFPEFAAILEKNQKLQGIVNASVHFKEAIAQRDAGIAATQK